MEEATLGDWKRGPYGQARSLTIKRTKRGWNEASLSALRDPAEKEVWRLLCWGQENPDEMFPVHRLPWNQVGHKTLH